jgi:hypothetical protein
MSFGSLLRHVVRIDRQVAVLDVDDEPTYSELGQPITATEDQGEWRCRIQPRNAREVDLLSQAGAVVADHLIHGYPVELEEADRLVELDGEGGEPTGRVFEVESIGDGGGAGHHLEVLARRTASEDVPAPAS